MPKARVFITRRLPEAGLVPLRGGAIEVDMRAADDPIDRAALLAGANGADAVITLLTDRVDAPFLEAAGDRLRIVANYAVGYDNIDVAACTRRGVAVANTPDVLTEATADQAFALLLGVARRVREGHDLVASGAWTGWEPLQLLGREVGGATLGIVGMGRIGRAVARRARGFGMSVLYHNRRRDPEAERELGARYVDLDGLLAASDFVSLHIPLTEDTHHLIDAAALAHMKPTAVLVNTARGPIVDEVALLDALRRGTLWGAGLDVFEHEPRVQAGLEDLDHVVLAPHTGSATESARTAMARLASEAVVAALAGRASANILNPDVLDSAS